MSLNWQIASILFVYLVFTQVGAEILGNDVVPITLLQNASQKSAVCLDGSPCGYYYASGSEDGLNNWILYLNGGGWCSNYDICVDFTKKNVGSTNFITNSTFEGLLSSNSSVNPVFYQWNRVLVHYCDGASFMGDSELNYKGKNLQFRGSRIFKAVVEELLERGMKNAQNAILSGGSAGGLACILHCDEFSAFLPNTKVGCIADAGFFIFGLNLPHAVDIREENFADVINSHNLTNLLSTSCKSRRDPKLCLFPEYLVDDIKTPLFILNSAFDSIQISKSLRPYPPDLGWDNCTADLSTCSPALRQLIMDFGSTFLDTIKRLGCNDRRGMFINACYSHTLANNNSIWNFDQSQRLANKTIAQAVGDWYFNEDVVQLVDMQTKFPLLCQD